MHLRKVKNASLIIDDAKDVCITNPTEYKGKWLSFYPKAQRIVLEIGMGKGQYLTNLALLHKDILYLGMEKMDSVICRAIPKVKENNLDNLILIKTDAINLSECFTPNEVDTIYLSFPDPWPKSRHDKRRLTHPRFLELYKQVLTTKGTLRLKTDNVDLYNYSLETMSLYLDNPKFGEYIHEELEPKTEFEEKYLKLGKKIYFIEGKFKNDGTF